MKARIWIVVVGGMAVANFASAEIFVDDFESGNLDNWVISYGQYGTSIAEVISLGGSQVAHLFHSGFTRTTLYRDFGYDLTDSYQFDLKVDVSSTPPPADNYYGYSYLGFQFLDSSGTRLGEVCYGAATTDYPYDTWDALNPQFSANAIPENVMNHYEIDMADIVSQITIDQTQIDSVRLIMDTYSSTAPSPYVTAQLWADNIQLNPPAIPVPGALILGILGLSVAGIRLRKHA